MLVPIGIFFEIRVRAGRFLSGAMQLHSQLIAVSHSRVVIFFQNYKNCKIRMAEGNGEISVEEVPGKDSEVGRTPDYRKLIDYGLDPKVAAKLDDIYKTGKLAHAELDERALDALKEFPSDGALSVLGQFLDSNLEHVSNKSAYLCGVMKTYRQKSRAGVQGAPALSSAVQVKGPDEDKIKQILARTGYTLDVTTGQRKYGGPPPGWEGGTPGAGCEVFCGKIPKDMYEDELIPLFERCGTIWDLRLMMDPMTGTNRGYAFVTFTSREATQRAVQELDNHEIKPGKTLRIKISVPNLRLFVGNIPKSKGKEEILEEFGKLTGCPACVPLVPRPLPPPRRLRRSPPPPTPRPAAPPAGRRPPSRAAAASPAPPLPPRAAGPGEPRPPAHWLFSLELFLQLNDYEIRKGKKIGVTVSFNNHRLFVGNIPKNRDRDDLFEEFTRHAPGLVEVIIYSSPDDKKKNRGFCFLEYESHKAASLAKRRLGTGRIKVWGCDIIVDWADPQEEPDEQTMSKVKVLYVRNLTQEITEEALKEEFERFGTVERVKKIKDYAFVHFEDRDCAVKAMQDLDGKEMGGARLEVSLAKPPSDKKKKEEILRARERRMTQMIYGRGGFDWCSCSPVHGALRGRTPQPQPRPPAARGDYDYDYDYYGYGDYRGGYNEPFYRYDEFYFDYAGPPQPSAVRQPPNRAQPEDELALGPNSLYYDLTGGIQSRSLQLCRSGDINQNLHLKLERDRRTVGGERCGPYGGRGGGRRWPPVVPQLRGGRGTDRWRTDWWRRVGHVGRARDGRGARRRARLGPVVVRDAPLVAAARPAPCVATRAPSQVYQVNVNLTGATRTKGGRRSGAWARQRRRRAAGAVASRAAGRWRSSRSPASLAVECAGPARRGRGVDGRPPPPHHPPPSPAAAHRRPPRTSPRSPLNPRHPARLAWPRLSPCLETLQAAQGSHSGADARATWPVVFAHGLRKGLVILAGLLPRSHSRLLSHRRLTRGLLAAGAPPWPVPPLLSESAPPGLPRAVHANAGLSADVQSTRATRHQGPRPRTVPTPDLRAAGLQETPRSRSTYALNSRYTNNREFRVRIPLGANIILKYIV
ncbi:unnamed protein product, partial [Iphiclides podalirius]